MRLSLSLVVAFCAACGFTRGTAATQTDTGGGNDATGGNGPAPIARVFGGAGRTTSGTMTIDVQIGEAVAVKQSTTGTYTISAATVFQP
jgi:hypothetical protein